MAEKQPVETSLIEGEVIDDDNVVTLSKPLRNGETQLVFDFDKINGYTLINCEKRAKKEDPSMMVPSLSMVYQAYVAAVAAGVKYDDILGLSAKDFTAACVKAQAFLFGTGR